MPAITLSGNLIISPDNTRIYLLYRKDHQFYETPGGKVKPEECADFNKPTISELEAVAKRELLEEVSGITEIVSMEFFLAVKFKVPDGRTAIANKFITRVKGRLCPREDHFDAEKSKWIKVDKLEKYPLSPDLKMLLPAIKEFFNQ